MSLFIRHVPALNERRLNSMFVDGCVRMMKHKYVTQAVSPTLRVADSLYPHYCSLLVQTELTVSSVQYTQISQTSECKSVQCVA